MEAEKEKKDKKKDKDAPKNLPIKKTSDLMKLKLEKLMQNIDKPVVIPERPKQKNGPSVPDFVRNVMGSSAGAGSGEFHVYRHLRRKEYARMKFILHKSELELLDDQYHQKLEDNKKQAEETTAKKRAKRLRKKQNKKLKGGVKKEKKSSSESSSDEEESEGEEGSVAESSELKVGQGGSEVVKEGS